MTAKSDKSVQPILVVQDEDVFASFLQDFPASRYVLLFAAGAAEAMALCESRSPRLMVVPLAGGGASLVQALRAVDHAGGKILGLLDRDEAPSDADPAVAQGSLPEEVDQAASLKDQRAILAAARALLEERRQHPRVIVELVVRFGESGQGIARDLSNRSLVVETTAPIKTGDSMLLELHWGDAPRTICATVSRVTRLDMGRLSALLLVDPKDEETRQYLDEVIRRILEVEHYLCALDPGRPAVRGPAAWSLARRAEKSLLGRAELGLTPPPDSPKATPQAQNAAAATFLSLSSRYKLGPARGQWGVGEVQEASHRLLERPVLLKRLAASLREDDTARKRMEAEARAASAVGNDCIADVLDFGDDGEGGLYYAMEWLEGQSLAEALASQTPFFLVDIARLGVHLSFALAAAHRLDVHHWDLCPEQVFLHRQKGGLSTPKLLSLAGRPGAPRKPPNHGMGLAFRPPGEASEVPGPGWDTFALCRLLERIPPADGAGEGAGRFRALLGRGASSDPTRRFDTMLQLCMALHQILRNLERDAGADLGAHIVPAVLPEELSVFRSSSTGLQVPLEPPLPTTWPRTSVPVLLPSEPPVEEPSGELVPSEPPVEEPSGELVPSPSGHGEPDEDSFEEEPTNVLLVEDKPDKKTLFGVPAQTAPGARHAPGTQTEAKPDKKTLYGVPAQAAPGTRHAPGPQVGAKPDKKTLYGVPARAAPGARHAPGPQVGAKPDQKTLYGVPAQTVPGARHAPGPQAGAKPDQKTLYGVPARAAPGTRPAAGTARGAPKDTGTLSAPAQASDLPLPPAPSYAGPTPASALRTATAPAGQATQPSPRDDLVLSAIADEIGDAAPTVAESGLPLDESHPSSLLPAPASLPQVVAYPMTGVAPARMARGPRLAILVGIVLVVLGAGFLALWFGVLRDRGTDVHEIPARLARRGDLRAPNRPLADASTVAPDGGARRALAVGDAGTERPTATKDAGAPSRDAGTKASQDAARGPDAGEEDPADDAQAQGTQESPMKGGPLTGEARRLELKRRLELRLSLIDRARALQRKGQPAAALGPLKEALGMWDSPRLRSLFANSYAAMGETWNAIHHQKRAVAQARKSPAMYQRLAQLFMKAGRRDRACDTYREALKAVPNHGKTEQLSRRLCGR